MEKWEVDFRCPKELGMAIRVFDGDMSEHDSEPDLDPPPITPPF